MIKSKVMVILKSKFTVVLKNTEVVSKKNYYEIKLKLQSQCRCKDYRRIILFGPSWQEKSPSGNKRDQVPKK